MPFLALSFLKKGFAVFNRALNRFGTSTSSIGSDSGSYGLGQSFSSTSRGASSMSSSQKRFASSLADEVAEAEIEDLECSVDTDDAASSLYDSSIINSSIAEDSTGKKRAQPILDLAVRTVAGALDISVCYIAERDTLQANSSFQIVSQFGLEGKGSLKLDTAAHNRIALSSVPSVFQNVRVVKSSGEQQSLPWWTDPPFSFHGGALVSCQSFGATGMVNDRVSLFVLVALTPDHRRLISSFGKSTCLVSPLIRC